MLLIQRVKKCTTHSQCCKGNYCRKADKVSPLSFENLSISNVDRCVYDEELTKMLRKNIYMILNAEHYGFCNNYLQEYLRKLKSV